MAVLNIDIVPSICFNELTKQFGSWEQFLPIALLYRAYNRFLAKDFDGNKYI